MQLHANRQIFRIRNIVLAIGGAPKYWLQLFDQHEDGGIDMGVSQEVVGRHQG